MNSIEVLRPSLLIGNSQHLSRIDHWLSVLNWSNGWHYDLDLIWLYNHLETLGLKKGSTILDAGGGLGVNQFVLASLGYNVISLDFTLREIPKLAKGIFNIELKQDAFRGGTHEYMEFMNYGQKRSQARRLIPMKHILAAITNPGKAKYVLEKRLREHINFSHAKELKRDHSQFGSITFLRGAFNSIPLPDRSVDALVSISAFEHNTYADMPGSVHEFTRVVKPGGAVYVTTSLAKDRDWFFEPSKGWNLTLGSLHKWFDLTVPGSVDYDAVLNEFRQSELLKGRLSPFYKYNGNNGLPYAKLEQAQYIPVGISKLLT